MTNIERIRRNVKVFFEENPELDSLSELNQIMEDEISCWEE